MDLTTGIMYRITLGDLIWMAWEQIQIEPEEHQ